MTIEVFMTTDLSLRKAAQCILYAEKVRQS